MLRGPAEAGGAPGWLKLKTAVETMTDSTDTKCYARGRRAPQVQNQGNGPCIPGHNTALVRGRSGGGLTWIAQISAIVILTMLRKAKKTTKLFVPCAIFCETTHEADGSSSNLWLPLCPTTHTAPVPISSLTHFWRAASYPGKSGWCQPTPTGLWPDGGDGLSSVRSAMFIVTPP